LQRHNARARDAREACRLTASSLAGPIGFALCPHWQVGGAKGNGKKTCRQ
jgi:hypothetical protein